MSDQTALERAALVIHGDRAELRVEGGRVAISKQAPTREAPTTVEFGVEQVRGTQLRAPSRGARGWLHLGVVGGSPAPPGELAAAGDPYTLPLTARSVGAARKLARLVDRHVQARGMPRDDGPNEGRLSSGVSLTDAPVTPASAVAPTPPPPPPPPPPAMAPIGLDDAPADEPDEPDELDEPGPAPAELVAELQALVDLRDSGALTDEEFARAKDRVLG